MVGGFGLKRYRVCARGFGEAESVQLTNWICGVLESLEKGNSEEVIADVKAKVLVLCKEFPVYGKSFIRNLSSKLEKPGPRKRHRFF